MLSVIKSNYSTIGGNDTMAQDNKSMGTLMSKEEREKEIERLKAAPLGTVLYYTAGGTIPREQQMILQEASISHTISSDSQYTYCIKG